MQGMLTEPAKLLLIKLTKASKLKLWEFLSVHFELFRIQFS